jgi:polyhydroxybutyrate depolymerase
VHVRRDRASNKRIAHSLGSSFTVCRFTPTVRAMVTELIGRKWAYSFVLLVLGCGNSGAEKPKESSDRALGCGKMSMSAARQLSLDGFDGLYYVSLPPDYDAQRPYPLGFAFHGDNRDHYDCRSTDCYGFQDALGKEAVLVYMQSLRANAVTEGGWGDERENNAAFFEAVLDSVESEFCIDEKRVFVAGTSSGAIFANLVACRYGDRLLAAAPIAGSLPEGEGCRGTPAALLIHGVDDPHVPFEKGELARDFYLSQNGCSAVAEPDVASMHSAIREKRDAAPTVEDIACADYQGCSTPVRWCEHSFGGYDLSTHGWPPAGGALIRDFVQGLQ